jgi:hypothetical protein
MRILGFILALAWSLNSQAQLRNIQVVEDYGIRRLLDQRKSLNFNKQRSIRVWSVQLMISRDKYTITETLSRFRAQFPEVKADWSYDQPYYKLNAGAFFTKLEATSLLHKLKKQYPEAFLYKNPQAKPSDM